MWVPKPLIDLFAISKERIETLQLEVRALQMERDHLQIELTASRSNFEWLRTRVNSLEIERAQLIEKAYGLKVPAPEITRTAPNMQMELGNNIFDHIEDDDTARKLDLPVWGKN